MRVSRLCPGSSRLCLGWEPGHGFFGCVSTTCPVCPGWFVPVVPVACKSLKTLVSRLIRFAPYPLWGYVRGLPPLGAPGNPYQRRGGRGVSIPTANRNRDRVPK